MTDNKSTPTTTLSTSLSSIKAHTSTLRTATTETSDTLKTFKSDLSKFYASHLASFEQSNALLLSRMVRLKYTAASGADGILKASEDVEKAVKDAASRSIQLKKGEEDLVKRKLQMEVAEQELVKRKRQMDEEDEERQSFAKRIERDCASKVKLDIGGKIFHISMDTLLRQEGTFFHSLFSGRWLVKPDETEENIFIDRDGELYPYIFNFLRDSENVVLPEDKEKRARLVQEAEFLGLDELKLKLLKTKRQIATEPLDLYTTCFCGYCMWRFEGLRPKRDYEMQWDYANKGGYYCPSCKLYWKYGSSP
ncbi:BTB/POZ domain-containing protein kctd3 [Rhizophlyctis rosea]|uniref:BTB/POZ domain-containing protein kctd3 n=1 Tax=Rhizophlyctis rosea TaxID=64517 RepID=A0AAD5S820_9FUNG|nr:BTB/POZ domain-containing protein kctd3 [Rhizophlyctis rosea]